MKKEDFSVIAFSHRAGEGHPAEEAQILLEQANSLAWSTVGRPGPCFWPCVSPEMVELKYHELILQIESDLEQAESLFLEAKSLVSPLVWGKLLEDVFTSSTGCWCGHSTFNNLI